jgi:hypothetical protein
MAHRTLIKGGTVITVDPALGDLPTGDVLIEDAAIVDVGPELEVTEAEVIDASDCLVPPGLVDVHGHTWQALFRNIASDWTLAHYNAHPCLVDTILVDGKVVKRDRRLVGIDHARVRRLAIESRDDIIRRAHGENGARVGGDWIPKAYDEAVAADA